MNVLTNYRFLSAFFSRHG